MDRLGWAAGSAVAAYGVRIGIRSTDPSLLAGLKGWEPPRYRDTAAPIVDQLFSLVGGGASASTRGVKRYHLLYAGSVRMLRTLDVSQLASHLDPLVDYAVAALSRRFVFVRAGAVGWQGRAILLPGPSFSGKSCLVKALLRAGATYYSDEYAVLGRDGRVYPYAKPLEIRRPEGEIVERLAPEALGAPTGREPLPIGTIIRSDYRPGANWQPRLESRSRGLAQLARQAIWTEQSAATKMAVLSTAVAGADYLASDRGEADAAAEKILEKNS